MNINIAFIALGSNLENPERQLKKAISVLEQSDSLTLLKKSSLYTTKPYGYQDQSDFCNAVVKISTILDSYSLLKYLQTIENNFGRIRKIHWGPRIIDLDILSYNNLEINNPLLTLPHPDLHNRKFVLEPWAKIEPNFQLPNGKSIQNLLNALLAKAA